MSGAIYYIFLLVVGGIVLYVMQAKEKRNREQAQQQKALLEKQRLDNLGGLAALSLPNATRVLVHDGMICKNCGTLNEFAATVSKKSGGPSIFITIALLLLCFPLAIVYLLFCSPSKKGTRAIHCQACGQANSMLPTNTPQGEQLCRQYGWYSQK